MADTAKNTVKSVAKAFEVLRSFDPSRPEMTISEVASRTGLDRGTAFRLIHTLIGLGYLAAIPGGRRYRLTLKCLDLGFNALSAGGLKAQCGPLLREMVPDLADAASLGVLDGADVVYVERAQVDLVRHDLDRRVGSRVAAYAAAIGHAILAWEPPEHARALLEKSERVRLSDRTLTDLDALCGRLAEVRQRGFAVSDGENAYGLMTIAMPIIGATDRAVAAISLTVRREREALDAFVARALPRLTDVVNSLSRAVGLQAAA